MSLRPDRIRGSASGGVVDYQLARRQVIREFRKGRLSELDVCDAHPELLRAATGVGHPKQDPCPICEDPSLVLVTYAFGPRLPAGGLCVSTAKEMTKLSRRRARLTCYVVEVCRECSWNHLVQVFGVGGDDQQRRESSDNGDDGHGSVAGDSPRQ